MTSSAWYDELDCLIQKNHMLAHPFYQAWNCGCLTLGQLQSYAKEYYHHVKAFPTYLSALHSRCEDSTVRKSLLKNLIDEEAGDPNHPQLWSRFAMALGVSREEIDEHQPSAPARHLVQAFKECCSSLPVSAGIAALYCYESQIPEVCTSKIAGLKRWYGMEDPEGYRYFSVHETADVEHSEEERKMLLSMVQPEEEGAVLHAAERVLGSLNSFLSSFCIM